MKLLFRERVRNWGFFLALFQSPRLHLRVPDEVCDGDGPALGQTADDAHGGKLEERKVHVLAHLHLG